jgi:ribose 5-phosphate isomerase B
MVSGRGGAIAPDIMDAMRVYLGSDHAGFELKARLVAHLTELGHEPIDCGAHTFDPQDDYPPPCIAAAARTVADPGSLGIVIGGSGNGEQIAANKVTGVRAALVWSDETARLAREHNNANILSIGARNHPEADALRFVEIFLDTPFSQDARHVRRIAMLREYETTGAIAGHQTS